MPAFVPSLIWKPLGNGNAVFQEVIWEEEKNGFYYVT